MAMGAYPPGCNGPPDDPPEYEQTSSVLVVTRWLNLQGMREAFGVRHRCRSRCDVHVDYADRPHEFLVWCRGVNAEDDLSAEWVKETVEAHICTLTGLGTDPLDGRDCDMVLATADETDEHIIDSYDYGRGLREAAAESAREADEGR